MRVCDITGKDPVVATLEYSLGDGDGNTTQGITRLDLGEKAYKAIVNGDWYALGLLVPRSARARKAQAPAKPRQRRQGAAQAPQTANGTPKAPPVPSAPPPQSRPLPGASVEEALHAQHVREMQAAADQEPTTEHEPF